MHNLYHSRGATIYNFPIYLFGGFWIYAKHLLIIFGLINPATSMYYYLVVVKKWDFIEPTNPSPLTLSVLLILGTYPQTYPRLGVALTLMFWNAAGPSAFLIPIANV